MTQPDDDDDRPENIPKRGVSTAEYAVDEAPRRSPIPVIVVLGAVVGLALYWILR
jgi:hypothetical protein